MLPLLSRLAAFQAVFKIKQLNVVKRFSTSGRFKKTLEFFAVIVGGKEKHLSLLSLGLEYNSHIFIQR